MHKNICGFQPEMRSWIVALSFLFGRLDLTMSMFACTSCALKNSHHIYLLSCKRLLFNALFHIKLNASSTNYSAQAVSWHRVVFSLVSISATPISSLNSRPFLLTSVSFSTAEALCGRGARNMCGGDCLSMIARLERMCE